MKIELEEKEVEAEVVDSVLKRALGLSFRKEGKMLFKFPKEVSAPIDMMMMRDSLYLYFMNREKEVIHVEKSDPWYRFPGKFLHRPDEEYRYLLESFEELDIKVGDELSF